MLGGKTLIIERFGFSFIRINALAYNFLTLDMMLIFFKDTH